jgi:hypothetical protein
VAANKGPLTLPIVTWLPDDGGVVEPRAAGKHELDHRRSDAISGNEYTDSPRTSQVKMKHPISPSSNNVTQAFILTVVWCCFVGTT